MPLYEYQCPKCESVFEKRVAMDLRQGAQDCPQCGTSGKRREFSIFAVSMAPSGNTACGYDAKGYEAPSCASGSCCSGGSCGLD